MHIYAFLLWKSTHKDYLFNKTKNKYSLKLKTTELLVLIYVIYANIFYKLSSFNKPYSGEL